MTEPNGNCMECGYRKAVINKKKGTKIHPEGGKCTRPGGYCKARVEMEFPMSRYQEVEDVPKLPEPMTEPPLSVRERKRLEELENVVVRNFQAFYDVGMALKEINENRLYRETHTAFSDYCRDIFEIARRTAYQYIEAARVVDSIKTSMCAMAHKNEKVSPIGDTSEPNLSAMADKLKNVLNCAQIPWLPANERQARALAKVPPERLPEVCQMAVSTAPDGKVTARHIKKTLKQLKLAEVKEITEAARTETEELFREEKIGARFKDAYQAFLAAVQAEIDAQWRHTDRSAVLRHIRILYGVIERDY